MKKRVVLIADNDAAMTQIVSAALAVHAEIHVLNEGEEVSGIDLGPPTKNEHKALQLLPKPRALAAKRKSEKGVPGHPDPRKRPRMKKEVSDQIMRDLIAKQTSRFTMKDIADAVRSRGVTKSTAEKFIREIANNGKLARVGGDPKKGFTYEKTPEASQ